MSILSPDRTLRTLKKNAALLTALIKNVTQDQAMTMRDGEDGWSVLFVLCHLRDYERIFHERIRVIREYDNPILPGMLNEQLARENDYANQDFDRIHDQLSALRKDTLRQLDEVSDDEWKRIGTHPEFGEGSLLEVCANAVMHDIDHLEQIARCLRLV